MKNSVKKKLQLSFNNQEEKRKSMWKLMPKCASVDTRNSVQLLFAKLDIMQLQVIRIHISKQLRENTDDLVNLLIKNFRRKLSMTAYSWWSLYFYLLERNIQICLSNVISWHIVFQISPEQQHHTSPRFPPVQVQISIYELHSLIFWSKNRSNPSLLYSLSLIKKQLVGSGIRLNRGHQLCPLLTRYKSSLLAGKENKNKQYHQDMRKGEKGQKQEKGRTEGSQQMRHDKGKKAK